ncbi:MAG: hypothetical protein JO030_07760 [Candidatus Eremiobacteraeota bacterium]|nr:hypothetical protein [Candidatus Eremiobacteraeota bacterium]
MAGSTIGAVSRWFAVTLGATALTGIALASARPAEQRGEFALLGGTPKIVSKFWTALSTTYSSMLFIRQYAADGTTPIRNYDLDMQKLMHLVIVRDDFATFAHVHPAFDPSTGTFSQRFTKERNHRYYVYADTDPRGIGQQVFRFTIESDGPTAQQSPPSGASATTLTIAPYTVTLSATTLPADRPQELGISVRREGRPAADLRPYLGAAAHAVFINTATLQYVHLHPMLRGAAAMPTNMAMPMSSQSAAGPEMQLDLAALPAASYKLWLQFGGAGDRVYTAPFTLLVR